MYLNCTEYRQSMQLLGLKQRLQEDDLDEREREAINQEIEALETKLRLD